MEYTPLPLDISGIELEETLLELVEQLAKNTHEIWAAQRIADGWTWGPQRSDDKRHHPCLVEYEELPEAEKEYDRKVTVGTLKTIRKLGYTIQPPATGLSEKPELDQLLANLHDGSQELATLLQVWRQHDPQRWKRSPQFYQALGHKILRLGEPLIAYDILSAATDQLTDCTLLTPHSNDPKKALYIAIERLRGLALAQSGAPKLAARILEKIIKYGADDGETAGIYGRICKDIASATLNPQLRQQQFRKALDIYRKAYQDSLKNQDIDSAYYNGINAATLSLLIGDEKQSKELATAVKEICLQQSQTLKANNQVSPYWLDATLGEAELLLGQQQQAQSYYQEAVRKTTGAIRDIASMKKQAKVLLQAQNISGAEFLESCFPLASVVICSGHMIDMPGQTPERFPIEREEEIRRQIASELAAINAGIAYSSAACGSDIIFLEEMVKRGGEINIVLPFEAEDFLATSVDCGRQGNWRKRFENLLEQASSIKVLGHYNDKFNNRNHYDFANLYIYGTAVARSLRLDSQVHTMAVWNGDINGGRGGTASAVKLWQKLGHTVIHINPRPTLPPKKQAKKELEYPRAKPSTGMSGVKHFTYLPMLFADVKGYSRLSEREVVEFSVAFLGKIGSVINNYDDGIVSKRTQGDGLFLVFKDMATAITVAQELQHLITTTRWSNFNLPDDLQMRISLDAGPTYSYIDPIVNKLEFCGDYVVRAARMEPITPPGEIFVSETFVAMAHAEAISNVHFDYAGQVPLPKNYGTIPAYHLRNTTLD